MPEQAQHFADAPRVRDPQHWVELITQAFAGGAFDSVRPLVRFIHPGFVGKAPQSPDSVGPDGWLDFFAGLYALVPDLKGEVLRSAATPSGDGMYVELRLNGTLKGRKLSVDVCDYFAFRDGLIARRVTYYDPLPLLWTLLLRPTALPTWLRLRFGDAGRQRASASARA